MADDVLVDNGTGSDYTVASDDIGGKHYQRVKLIHGADGVNDGDVSSANPLPVKTSGYDAADDMLKVKSVQKKFRDSFPGVALDTNKWDSSVGSGGSITVSGGTLVMASGTTANSVTSITSKEVFTVPFRLGFSLTLSQRIANQEFFVEAISVNAGTGVPDGLHAIAWRFDGTSATQAIYETQNGGLARLASSASTIPTTAGSGFYELEPFADEAWWHGSTMDSTSGRANSYRRHQQIPDPNAVYKLRLRWVNGATPPAGTTSATLQFVACQDYAELTAEITAGRGQVAAGQSIGVHVVGSTSITPGTGTSNLGKAEDAAHSSGHVGVMALAVRNDAHASLSGTDLDYTPIAVDSAGRVQVTLDKVGAGDLVLGAAATAASIPVNIASDQTVPVSVSAALPAGSNVIGALTANQSVNVAQMNGVAPTMGNGASGTGVQRVTLASDSTGNIATIGTSVTPGTSAAHLGKAEDAVHASGDTGVMALAVRKDTATALAGTDGDYIPLITDNAGRLHVTLGTAIPAGSNVIGALTANQSVNVAQMNGVATTMGNGASGTGVQRVTLASDSTGNIATIGTSVTPGTSAAHLGKAEDAAHSSGDTGVMALAVRNENRATLSGTELDYTPIAVTAEGVVLTARADDTASGALSSTASVTLSALHGVDSVAFDIRGTFSATLAFEATNDDSNWFAVNAVVPTTGAVVTTATAPGQWLANTAGAKSVRVRCSSYGSGTANVVIRATGGTGVVNFGSPLPAGTNIIGALSANQSVNVAQMNGVATTMGNGTSGTGVQRVTLASDSTGNIATIGTSVTPGTSAAHLGKAQDSAMGGTDTGVANLMVRRDSPTNLTPAAGDYAVPQINAQGAQYVHPTFAGSAAASIAQIISAATANATSIKASAGVVTTIAAINNSSSWRYLKLHNIASAPTAGSGVVATYGLPPGGGITLAFPTGLAFSTGIGATITAGIAAADTAVIGANEVAVTISYH